jgi:hypothetical protein
LAAWHLLNSGIHLSRQAHVTLLIQFFFQVAPDIILRQFVTLTSTG